jgi:hypothetical protein
MSLTDKFQIIEPYSFVPNKIDSYFENLICSDINIYAPYFVDSSFSHTDYNVKIEEYVRQHLISRRNNIRSLLKADNYHLSNMNSFIKHFLTKLEHINTLLRKDNDIIIRENIKLLSNLIISDSIILLFIEDLVNSFDRDQLTSIQQFINIIKMFNKYDDGETYSKVLTNFSNSFTKQFLNMEQIPLPLNIKKVQELCSIIKYTTSIEEYYKFLHNDITMINKTNYDLIISKFIDVLIYNTPFEIKYTIDNIKSSIYKMNTHVFNNEYTAMKIIIEVINLIVRYEKSSEYILDIIDIISFIDKILNPDKFTQSFKIRRGIITEKFAELICSENVLELIHSKIDDHIRDGRISDAIHTFSYCTNVKDKDVFINKYYEQCKTRLMQYISTHTNISGFTNSIANENYIIEFLKQKYGDKVVYKIKKIVDDAKASFDNMMNFNRLIKNNNIDKTLTVLTTSYKNWDINQSEGVITTNILQNMGNTVMGKALRNYKKFYDTRYEEKRVLFYSLHFGEVDITYMGQQLIMLPIQFCVLELYNNTDTIDISKLKSSPFFMNYSDKFRNDTIYSLISGGLFKTSGSNIILATSGQFKQNLIEIFFTNSDYSNIWQENKNRELAHSREEIIMANINHLIKTHNMSLKELYENIRKSITLFDVTHDMFDKSIQYMILHQYIKIDSNNVIKVIW